MQCWMSWFLFKNGEVSVRQTLDVIRQFSIVSPEAIACIMVHNSLNLPFLKSAIAFLAMVLILPFLTSSLNCLSHTSASNSSKRVGNRANTFHGGFRIALSLLRIV